MIELLDELSVDALEMIALCKTETELNDVKALLLGQGSYFKQMEQAMWPPKAKKNRTPRGTGKDLES